MDIACPNCTATYRVPDTLLASGKPLRCAACGHEWVPEAPPAAEPEPSTPEGAMPAFPAAASMESAMDSGEVRPETALPEPRRANPGVPPPLQRRGPPHHGKGPLPEVRAAPRREALLPIAWLVSVIMVVLMVLGLLLFREEIAQAWPPFARVAGLMGGFSG